jgi:hypothetical protein
MISIFLCGGGESFSGMAGVRPARFARFLDMNVPYILL